jgi:hypothetical protein
MYQVPSSVVTDVKTKPVAGFDTVTLARGITAPLASVTLPVNVAVPVD